MILSKYKKGVGMAHEIKSPKNYFLDDNEAKLVKLRLTVMPPVSHYKILKNVLNGIFTNWLTDWQTFNNS